MVANGYDEVDGERYVSIVDPWAPCAGDELMRHLPLLCRRTG